METEKRKLSKDEILRWIKMDQDFNFEYLNDEEMELICDDREIVMLAVEKYWNLEYTSDRLKDDEKIVLLACGHGNCFTELQHASERLKNNLKFL
jgi:peptide subunit release factor RF-3